MSEEYLGRKFKTVFVDGDVESEDVGVILDAGVVLNDSGLTPENAGNISVRTERGMLITVGGKNKGSLTREDVVEVVSFDGEVAEAVGSSEPSSETPMHWMIYENHPQYKALVHVHDQFVLSVAGELDYPVTGEAEYGTPRQASMVTELIGIKNYVVIRDHGIVCGGSSIGECLELLFQVHDKAKSLVED